MANAWYKKGLENFLGGDIDVDANAIKFTFNDNADYTVNINTDDALNDIPSGARVATSTSLTSKTKTDGVFDAADHTVSAVSGDPFESISLFKDTGTESTSFLFIYIDTATGLPLTPNGGDVTVQWDNGANRIAAI